ncbi:hypothetical protein Q9966_003320 [Columba livia]|nr:hypothetical protein Q9966_003320 [Columba livia]
MFPGYTRTGFSQKPGQLSPVCIPVYLAAYQNRSLQKLKSTCMHMKLKCRELDIACSSTLRTLLLSHNTCERTFACLTFIQFYEKMDYLPNFASGVLFPTSAEFPVAETSINNTPKTCGEVSAF